MNTDLKLKIINPQGMAGFYWEELEIESHIRFRDCFGGCPEKQATSEVISQRETKAATSLGLAASPIADSTSTCDEQFLSSHCSHTPSQTV